MYIHKISIVPHRFRFNFSDLAVQAKVGKKHKKLAGAVSAAPALA